MGTAQLLITDTQTSVYVWLQLQDSNPDTDGFGNIYNPPFKSQVTAKKRTLAKSEIPQHKYDVVQDMDQTSPTTKLTGIATLAVKNQLDIWFDLPQIDTAYLNGRFTATMSDRNGNTLWSIPNFAIEAYQASPKAAMPNWFDVMIDIVVPGNA